MRFLNRTTTRFGLGIILPAVLILIGAFTTVLVSLEQMADTVNSTENALTRRSAEAAIHASVRHLGETLTDYAHWDDAVRNLYGEPDTRFVDENFSASTANPVFFDTAYLIDAGGNTVFAFRLGESASTPADKAFGPSLARMISELPANAHDYDVRSGLVNGAWGLAMVAVGPVVPVMADTPTPSSARFLVMSKAVDIQALQRLGEDYVIDKLGLTEPSPKADNKLELADFNGNTIAWLTWTPRQLGTRAHAGVNSLALAMLGLLGLTMVYLVVVAIRGLVHVQRNEGDAQYAATHDSLTGLPNRSALVLRLESAIAAMRRGGTAVAVAYLDLDGFKEVNDSYGHEIGDSLLRKVARAFQEICGEHLLVRVGGDEFAVVIERPDATAVATEVGERLVSFFEERLDIDGRVIPLSTSVGIVVVDSTGISVDELLRRADVAMYQAKQLGRDRICIFDRSLDTVRLRQARRPQPHGIGELAKQCHPITTSASRTEG